MREATLDDAHRPWQRWNPPGVAWNARVPIGTLPDLLEAAAARFVERPALRFGDASLSYAGLAGMAAQLAQGLRASGIEAGDRIALYLPNTPWHPVCFFAGLRAGARLVHLSPLDPPRVLAYKLADSAARILVTTNLPGMLPAALGLLAAGAVDKVLVGDAATWGATPSALPLPDDPRVVTLHSLMRATAAGWPAPQPDDVALLQYTGGTTGRPRAAMLTHANLTAAVESYVLSVQDFERAGGVRVVGVLPLFHIYALTRILLLGLRLGNEILLHARFDVEAVLRDVGERRAAVMAGVPTMWIALADHPAAAACDFSGLRSALSGGAPMPSDVAARVGRIVGRRLLGGWGMTETAPAGTRIPAEAPPAPGLIGVPLPGIDLRVVSLDDPSVALPPGGRGELAIRGANVFAGYWNRPDETAAAFRDGWLLTGDIGTMGEDGLFRILDRKKAMIISGGFNVYPAMVENAIYEHPAVREVIVAGVPDPYRGQAAKAFVSLVEGAAPFALADLQAFLSDKLGRHEIPTALEFRDQLPRSPVGKLLRSELEREIALAYRKD
jgi:long-chain acyl-CoA synthetase